MSVLFLTGTVIAASLLRRGGYPAKVVRATYGIGCGLGFATLIFAILPTLSMCALTSKSKEFQKECSKVQLDAEAHELQQRFREINEDARLLDQRHEMD